MPGNSKNARTCIIATVGPASGAPDKVAALIAAGVNVFRLNFSHGEREQHARQVAIIREAAKTVIHPIAILQDLQGPKIRVGQIPDGGRQLEPGQKLTINGDRENLQEGEVGVSYGGLARDVEIGDELLFDDGRIAATVKRTEGKRLVAEITRGGKLSSNKGINLPGSDLRIPALSDKDVEDIRVGAELGVDWVAMSFVRNRDDVFLARHYLERFESSARLMAKIEKPSAVQRFDEILDAADGIMIARGDLGVELSTDQVPIVQKRLIRACRQAGKPVVTATQMLDSMTLNPFPTRAEASDVANAIYDGTDAVMLSGETAVGEYPVLAVQTMNRIALAVESDPAYRRAMAEKMLRSEHSVAEAVAHAACQMASEIKASVIVTFSSSGATAARVARYRVAADVLAITPNPVAFRQLALYWGVEAVHAEDDIHNSDEMVAEANRWILETGVAKPGEEYVMTAGVPFGVSGTTNLIRVEEVVSPESP